jgi:hypothetical protein
VVLVVHEQRVLTHIGHVDELARAVRAKLHAPFPFLAEADRLLVLEADLILGLLLDRVERAVVVDVAVLVDLDQRRPLVRGGAAQDLGQVLLVGVDRARHEGGLRAQRDRDRVEGPVERPHRRRLVPRAERARRRVLPFREPVDLVVEEQDLDVHVPAQRMDQVVAADRQRVTVAGHDPDGQVRSGRGEARRDRRRASVDRVHPVGLHVVGEARGAADPGDEHDLLAR